MNYKSIISTIALFAIILPIIAPLVLEIPLVTAQLQPVIVNIHGPINVAGLTYPGVYPGDTIMVEVYVPFPQPFTVKLVNSYNDSIVYDQKTVTPYQSGYVNVTLVVPKELRELIYFDGILTVNLYVGPSPTPESKQLSILPLVEVYPTVTPPQNNITVTIYGLQQNTVVQKIYIGTHSILTSKTPDEYGRVIVPVNLTGLCLPQGTYVVSFEADPPYGVSSAFYRNASLTIRPIVKIINVDAGEPAGHGMWVNITGNIFKDNIVVEGYGFPANVKVTTIRLQNTNFTNVYYDFPVNVYTNSCGCFNVTDLLSKKPTNMTAGLYIPIVYIAPRDVNGTATEGNVTLGKEVTVSFDLSVLNIGLEGFINATSQINGTLGYAQASANQSINKNDVLSILIVDGAKKYILSANLNPDYTVTFALYNATALPYVTLFNVIVNSTYNSTLGANVTAILFNLNGTYNISISEPGYRYKAEFYEYANQILLILYEYKLTITGGFVYMIHTPSGQNKTYTTENLTVVGTVVKTPTWKFTHEGYTYQVNWVYDVEAKVVTMTVTVSLPETPYEFRNVYYLVRPVLMFLVGNELRKTYPTSVMPNETITIVAFGYSPGYGWYDFRNNLTVTLDMVSPLFTGELGRDGNLTFKITIPPGTTFGAHYIHGIDSRGYEYSVAIVVGAKGVFITVGKPTSREASASYYNTRIEACPCAVYEGKSFCDVCVVYTGDCDYLGDYIEVELYGLRPNETLIDVYLNGTKVPPSLITPSKPVADSNGYMTFKFLVPSIPEGEYTIRVITSVSGEQILSWKTNTTYTTFIVKPKLLLVTLDSNLTSGKAILPVIVGSGVVRVIGTGFKPGLTFDTIVVNMTDAFRSLYTHVRDWKVDTNGIIIGGKVAGQDLYPALLFPVLQPGKYEVRIVYYEGTTTKISEPGYIYVVNNLTFVATKDDVTQLNNAINTGFNNVQTSLNNIVSTITTSLNTFSTKLDDISRQVSTGFTDVKSMLNDINSTLTTVRSDVGAIKSDMNTVKTTLNTIQGMLASLGGKLDNALAILTDVESNVTLIRIKTDKIDELLSKIKTDELIVKLDALTGKISTLETKVGEVDTKVQQLSKNTEDRFSALDNKVSSTTASASTSMYISIAATLFALLATIFSLLAYTSIKKSVAPK